MLCAKRVSAIRERKAELLPPTVKVFMDTSALFSAIWSQSGGARMILKLGEAKALLVIIGPQVLDEIDEVLRAKYPQGLAGLARLFDRSNVVISSYGEDDILAFCQTIVPHPGDALVLAEAWCSAVDFFATHDKIHFTENESVTTTVPFLVGSPGDFLTWYRKRIVSGD